MDTVNTSLNSAVDISCSKIVIVMGVEIKLEPRVATDHLMTEIIGLIWIQNTESVRQHKPFDRSVDEALHQRMNVIWRVDHSIGPVLEVNIDVNILRTGVGDNLFDLLKMLLR